MSRLPFLPLYVNDFLGATTLWDGEEKGLYAILLILQWQSGPLPEDLAKLAKTAAYDVRKFRSLWKTVGKKFKITARGRINLRLEEHRDRAIEVHGQRVNNGKKGGRPKKLTKTERLSKRKADGSVLLKLNESNSDIQILRSSDLQNSENHRSQAEGEGGNGSARAARKPAPTHLPADFELTSERLTFASQRGVDAEKAFAKFKAHWRRTGRSQADWDAAWEFWVLEDVSRAAPKKTRFDENTGGLKRSVAQLVLDEVRTLRAADPTISVAALAEKTISSEAEIERALESLSVKPPSHAH